MPQKSVSTVAQTTSVTAYNVYRRDYSHSDLSADSLGNYELIASTDTTNYLDSGLSLEPTNCYQYYVTAVYEGGESGGSNEEVGCLFTGLEENSDFAIKVYPNPASKYLSVESQVQISQFQVYNPMGLLLPESNNHGGKFISIDTQAFPAGIYTLKITDCTGKSKIIKFMVIR